MSRQLAGY